MNKEIERNTKGLTDVLFTEIEAIRAGESTPQRAREVSRLASSIVQTAKLELEARRFISGESSKEGGLKAIGI